MVRPLTFNLSFIRKANMTISNVTIKNAASRNLVDICGIGNEKTVLSHKALADWAIVLAETVVVMQDAVDAYEKSLQDAGVVLPSTIGSILPEYLNVKDKVIIDVCDLDDGDPMILSDTVQLDLDQFISICENVPPLCWSHFMGKTDGAMQTSSPPTANLNDLADELEEVSSEAAAAVRAYIEKHCPKTYIVKFSHLVEQDFEIEVKAANEDAARKAVLMYGIDATEEYKPDWEDERVYEECANIESIELSDEN